MNYLYSDELIGYVDLSDLNETWPKCSLDFSAPKRVKLYENRSIFLVTS